MSRETIFTANGALSPLVAAAASAPEGTSTSFAIGMPKAVSTALLSASLSVTAPAGRSRPFGMRTSGGRRGSRRRWSAAKRASAAAARASRTGVVMCGTPASVSALSASGDFACRPDQATWIGLSVRFATSAMASHARAAVGPDTDASRMESWSRRGSASTTSSAPVKRRMSLKKPAVTSAGFSGEPNAGTILRRAASVSSENGGSSRPPRTAASA